jgi:hypothetical protein
VGGPRQLNVCTKSVEAKSSVPREPRDLLSLAGIQATEPSADIRYPIPKEGSDVTTTVESSETSVLRLMITQ